MPLHELDGEGQFASELRFVPLMRFVELGDVRFVEATPLNLPRGGNMLIDSHLGVLMGVAAREGYEDLVQGFEIVGRQFTETRPD